MDPYAVLGLHPGATKAEIKKAFRQKAMAHHPDMCAAAVCCRWLAAVLPGRQAVCPAFAGIALLHVLACTASSWVAVASARCTCCNK